MASNGAENAAISGNDEARCSETTVEIKIKTLDSQTYTMRVDKCVPVPALKEQIATVTGVLSEQQRLICRGKVLKDDQLLSAYHVEDGHTLHLVVRQPVAPATEYAADHPESDPASSSGHGLGGRVGASVLVGSFNVSEQGDGIPDLGRIVSTVLNSFGITGVGSGGEEMNLNEPGRERATIFALGGQRNSNRQQPDQADTRNQPIPNISSSSLPTGVPPEPLQPLVIPDSLTTLSQYLTHLRQEVDTTVRGLSNTSHGAETCAVDGQDIHASSHPTGPAGLPTPAYLAEVVMATRQLLNEQAADCLLQLSRQMENQANVTDPSERTRIQTYALRSGANLQNLGALLLELGRTVMTLRMGQTSGDAIVNAGPAIFISTTGPNPIMVQPLPLQPGTSFGTIPVGAVQHTSGFSGGSVSSGFIPRNIDIRIRTARDRRDPTSSQQQGQTVPPTSDNSTSAQQATAEGTGPSSVREPEVRVLPLRNLLSAAPPPIVHSAPESSGRSLGIFFPVLARVQHVTSRNSNNTRASQVSDQNHARNVDTGRSSTPNSAHQANIGVPNLDVGGTSNSQGFSTQVHDGLNQLLRTIISGEHLHGHNVDSHNIGDSGVEVHTVVAQDADSSQEATQPVTEEGLVLSNILHQIMPIVSQSIGTTSNSSSADGGNAVRDRTIQASTQVSEAPTDLEQGPSSRRRSSRQRRDPLSQPSPPKRPKRD